MNKTKILTSAALFAALLCAGCDIKYQSQDGGTIKAEYKCTAEQLSLVKMQLDVCDDTGYLSTYCFDTARAEHCSLHKGT